LITIRQRLLHGVGWALAARGIGVVSGLAVNAFLARMLTPDDMGAYFLSLSVAAFLSTVGQLGMPTAVVRVLAESIGLGKTGRAHHVIVYALGICGLIGGVLAGVYAIVGGAWLSTSVFHSVAMSYSTGWLALLGFLLVFQGFLAESFRGFHDIRLASLMGGVSTSLFSAVAFSIVWFMQGHADLMQALALSAGAAALSVVISASLLTRRVRFLVDDGSRIAPLEIVAIGWPLCITSVAVLIAVQGDLWVVGAMLSKQDVAIYGAALRLLAMMTMFHGLIVAVTQSTVAELYAKGDKGRLQDVVQGATSMACLVAGGVLLIFVVFGQSLLGLVFGSNYESGYVPLLILAFGQFIGMLFGSAGMVMMMTGHQQLMMWIIVVNTFVGLLLAVLVAPLFGLMGVALSWGGVAILQGGISWLVVKWVMHISCHASWKIILKETKKKVFA